MDMTLCLYPSIDDQVGKVWYICVVEYYPVIFFFLKMVCACNWNEIEKKIILNEITQTQNDKYGIYSLKYEY